MSSTWCHLEKLRPCIAPLQLKHIKKGAFFSKESGNNILRHISCVPDNIQKPAWYSLYGKYRYPVKPTIMEVKTEGKIQKMRDACKVAREVLDETSRHVKTGITTCELDKIAHACCIQHNVYPSPLLYRDYPKSICTSVNEVACHGIPGDRQLKDGDIINIDVTVFCNGFHGDVSETYTVGNVSEEIQGLLDIARLCMEDGIRACGPEVPFSQIGKAISELADACGVAVIPSFCGHGIGEYFHGPDVLHVENNNKTPMKEGMTFTIEPIICDGDPEVEILGDGWTAVTVDRSWSAQFEHTVLITSYGVDILTQ